MRQEAQIPEFLLTIFPGPLPGQEEGKGEAGASKGEGGVSKGEAGAGKSKGEGKGKGKEKEGGEDIRWIKGDIRLSIPE